MPVLISIRADLGDPQRWLLVAMLALPIIVAILAVVVGRARVLSNASPRATAVDVDRQRLGDRRYTSNRLWFSAFVSQLTAAEGIETHVDEALDLELVSIQQSMLKASASRPSSLSDDDRDALEWLTAHFRRDLLNQEAESVERPGIGSCWLGFGELTHSGRRPRSRGRLDLRLVNAGDLGRQVFVSLEWIDRRRSLRRSSTPVATVIREREPAMLVERVRSLLDAPAARAGHREPDSFAKQLVVAASSSSVDAPLTDPMIGVLQNARNHVAAAWGDQWWTGGPVATVEIRSGLRARSELFSDTDPSPCRESRTADRRQRSALT